MLIIESKPIMWVPKPLVQLSKSDNRAPHTDKIANKISRSLGVMNN